MNQPPTFTALPEPLEVVEKEPVELLAKAQGKPTPSITWYRNDKLVKEDATVQTATTEEGLEATGKCSMPAVELGNEGRYTIEAANKVGKVTADVPVTGMKISYI